MEISNLEIDWAKDTLKKHQVTDIKIIANTDYSFVAEIKCKNDVFFLKKNHSLFNYEDKLLSYLYQNQTNDINVYDKNQDLNCFITENSGIQITNNLVGNCTNIADKFIDIQIKCNVTELSQLGLRKFSTNEILEVCSKYQINPEQLLTCWNEIEKIIPLSLEHGDFHLGNILLDNNANINFIDLAEGTITNPLFSLLSFENTLKWRGNLEQNIIEQSRDYWLKVYSQKTQLDFNIIQKVYSHSKTIFPLYCIFGLDFLLQTCCSNQYIEKINTKILNYKELLNK